MAAFRPLLAIIILFPAAAASASESSSLAERFSDAVAGGDLVSFGIAFAGGLLTSFTPCVCPLIPVTVGFFASVSPGRGRRVLLSAVYVLGLASMYSSLGLVSALTGSIFGSIMNNGWVVAAAALIMALFAASMFGAFEMRFPEFLTSRVPMFKPGSLVDAFLRGLFAGIIAAPCTGPVLGAILLLVAGKGSPLFGASLLFAFSVGMGLPFFVLALFSSLLAAAKGRMGSGRLTLWVKSFFGIALLVTSLFLLKNVSRAVLSVFELGSRFIILPIALTAIGLASGALHKRFADELDEGPVFFEEKARKTAGVILTVIGLFMLIGAATAGKHGAMKWMLSESEGTSMARLQNKPAMIDFYADWCIACVELDRETFSDAGVQAEAERFIAIKVDGTQGGGEFDKLTQKYGIVGMPTVVFVDPSGKILDSPRIMEPLRPAAFIREMRKVH